MQIKETKILLDDFLLFFSIFCKKQNSEKMDEKIVKLQWSSSSIWILNTYTVVNDKVSIRVA